MNIIQKDHGPYCPFPIRLIGGILMLGAIYNLADVPDMVPTLLGTGMILAGLLATTSRAGIQLDFENRVYRDYVKVFKSCVGKWNTIPEIEYISVFGAMTSQNINSQVSGTKLMDKSFEVNIIGAGREKIFVQDYDRQEDALKLATRLSGLTGARIYLASEQRYLDEAPILSA